MLVKVIWLFAVPLRISLHPGRRPTSSMIKAGSLIGRVTWGIARRESTGFAS